ncbi:MAG: Na+/H+ antiporter NhaC family protein [Planctomycetota bacterium]
MAVPGVQRTEQPEDETAEGILQVDRPPVMPRPVAATQGAEVHDVGPRESTVQPTTTSPDVSSEYETKDLIRAIAPAMVAILLAILTRQVLVALAAGILVAAAMMQGMAGQYHPIGWVTHAVDHYLFGVLAPMNKAGTAVDLDHLEILVFTLFIGAMVGIIEANGGTRAMVARVTRRVRTRQTGQLGGFVAGLVVFFDDYANAMIVGPSMRPIFDRLRLSREKLAYIVDSTAAPVASIFVGTWLAYEITQLDSGFDALGDGRPTFLAGVDGTMAFWASIPYRTYALLALVMVFLIALTGRDFGSMRKAEARALAARAEQHAKSDTPPTPMGEGWWLGAVPVATLVLMVFGLLAWTGWRQCTEDGLALSWGGWAAVTGSLGKIIGAADSYPALVYGSLTAAVVAVVISVTWSPLRLSETMEAAVSGMARMFTACIILVLAWGLSEGGKDLNLGEAACALLRQEAGGEFFSVTLLPLAVFLTAGFISFSTGTSYGTMAILCPVVIPISGTLLSPLPPDQAMPLFYATVGAVLTGAVFGDHCSPISDTTVLSSIASECDLSKHVWTQMPYAFTVAIAGILSTDGLGYVLRRWTPTFYERYRPLSWAYGLVLGSLLLLLVLLIFGRRPRALPVEPVASPDV